MTQRDSQRLDRIIGQMTDAEKQELLDRLARSLNGGQNAAAPADEKTPEQKKRIADSFREIAKLPNEGPITVFFDNPCLEDLAAAQGVQPIADTAQLYGDFWPESEGVDDFLEARRSWRAEG